VGGVQARIRMRMPPEDDGLPAYLHPPLPGDPRVKPAEGRVETRFWLGLPLRPATFGVLRGGRSRLGGGIGAER
jgi:hypothetical protein